MSRRRRCAGIATRGPSAISRFSAGHAVRSIPRVALGFEWDALKAISNVLNDGVRFDEAETVFGDPLSTTITDSVHALDEARFVKTGMSNQGRLLGNGCAETAGGFLHLVHGGNGSQPSRRAISITFSPRVAG